ncbi:hypothetical protein WR25_15526 [Diploscapter pachys]|uniref:Uncharacterized protein n=1 Tax=Diploscapter pachys TaxID=2018661 RepID=A0A2A2KPJ2_9BILA|nr:hypothetical protein WR25_15526 [Diploscapter pachys]
MKFIFIAFVAFAYTVVAEVETQTASHNVGQRDATTLKSDVKREDTVEESRILRDTATAKPMDKREANVGNVHTLPAHTQGKRSSEIEHLRFRRNAGGNEENGLKCFFFSNSELHHDESGKGEGGNRMRRDGIQN